MLPLRFHNLDPNEPDLELLEPEEDEEEDLLLGLGGIRESNLSRSDESNGDEDDGVS